MAGALLYLRQRNTYQGNSGPLCSRAEFESSMGPMGNDGHSGHAAFPLQDPGSHVLDIVEGSRRKARVMVDIAMTVIDDSHLESHALTEMKVIGSFRSYHDIFLTQVTDFLQGTSCKCA